MYLPRASMFIPQTKRGHGSAHSPLPPEATEKDRERASRQVCELCRHLKGEARHKAHVDPASNRKDWEAEHKTSFPLDVF